MELVLKLPKGKPPFVGIAFEKETEASKLHSEIADEFRYSNYKILFEYKNKSLGLRLICEERIMVYFYNNLQFNADKFKSWLYMTGNTKQLNFGHIYRVNSLDKIAVSPGRKNFFVSVRGYELITSESIESNGGFRVIKRQW